MGKNINSKNGLDCKRDWLHQIISEVIKLDDQRQAIQIRLTNSFLNEEDIEEIITFFDSLSLIQRRELSQYDMSSSFDVNEKIKPKLSLKNVDDKRQFKIKNHFINRAQLFNV